MENNKYYISKDGISRISSCVVQILTNTFFGNIKSWFSSKHQGSEERKINKKINELYNLARIIGSIVF